MFSRPLQQQQCPSCQDKLNNILAVDMYRIVLSKQMRKAILANDNHFKINFLHVWSNKVISVFDVDGLK